MWVVVIFSNENSVECIPKCWLTDDSYCYWPSYKGTKLKSAIAACEKPQDNWVKFHIRRISGDKVYDDLLQARTLCDRAQYTSDISDVEEVKRKPKKKILSSSSSEDDENSPSQYIKVLPSPPRTFRKPREYSEQFQQHQNDEVTNISKHFERSEGCHGTSKGSNSTQAKDSPLKKKSTDSGFDNKTFQEFQQQVIRKLSVMNLKLDQISTDIVTLMNTRNPDTLTRDLQNINFNLPLNSMQELTNFENELTREEKKVQFLAYLEKIGGNNEYDNVKRIFSRILTNELANEYNWLGLKNKKAFNTLQLTNIAKDAVLKNPKLKNSTEKNVEFAIKNWLRHAKDRMKKQGTEHEEEAVE